MSSVVSCRKFVHFIPHTSIVSDLSVYDVRREGVVSLHSVVSSLLGWVIVGIKTTSFPPEHWRSPTQPMGGN